MREKSCNLLSEGRIEEILSSVSSLQQDEHVGVVICHVRESTFFLQRENQSFEGAFVGCGGRSPPRAATSTESTL